MLCTRNIVIIHSGSSKQILLLSMTTYSEISFSVCAISHVTMYPSAKKKPSTNFRINCFVLSRYCYFT